MKGCLDCYYEPDWSRVFGSGNYKRRVGHCRCKVELPVLPAVYKVTKIPITRYDDNSGVVMSCDAWKPKGIKGDA